MKVNEVFASIQGEGRYQGAPVIFVRLSGCTRKCSFCDSRYHLSSVNRETKDLAKQIQGYWKYNNGINTIVWTGGEPLLQFKGIQEVITLLAQKGMKLYHHIETNGDLIKNTRELHELLSWFSYVCVSPKEPAIIKKIHGLRRLLKQDKNKCDIKVVTDMQMNKSALSYATMLMPLTTNNKKKDNLIRDKVWNYCTYSNKFYSARIHAMLFGLKRGI